jgi:ketosteroid isomerase-like protein
MLRRLTLLAAASLIAAPALAEPVTPAPVVAAERAFAVDGLALGVKASFLKHSAPDAIVIQPQPVNAHESLAKAPDARPGDPALEWWPVFAGISKSGDLGFTTGPYAVAGQRRGHYFTVWKKQLNGEWKWLFDGGTPSDPAGAPGPGGPVGFLTVADVPPMDSARALAEVMAVEDALATVAVTDLKAGFLAVYACDGRMQGSALPPATTCEAAEVEMATRPAAARLKTLGGEASSAGDLVWTYGVMDWSGIGGETRGHYVRVWQRRADGWRIVFDELLVPPPPRPN